MTEQPFTHLDAAGHARMVDVTAKQSTVREATAANLVRCSPQVVAALRSGDVPKGDVLAMARTAGIAVKRTAELLPLAPRDRQVRLDLRRPAGREVRGQVGRLATRALSPHLGHVWSSTRSSLPAGRGRRLGGADKAEVVLAGRALIDRVLDAATLGHVRECRHARGTDQKARSGPLQHARSGEFASRRWCRTDLYPMSALVTVRYFAAAAEAAGVATETLSAGSVGDLVASMVRSHGPGLQHVLARCSLLAAGVHVSDDATLLADGVTVDVLPPFAGG